MTNRDQDHRSQQTPGQKPQNPPGKDQQQSQMPGQNQKGGQQGGHGNPQHGNPQQGGQHGERRDERQR